MRIDYPRRGRTGVRRFLPSWRQWLAFVGAGFFLLVAAFAVLYARIDVPQPNDQALQQSSVIFFADGRTVLGRFGQTNRESVPLSQVPLSLQREAHKPGDVSPTQQLRFPALAQPLHAILPDGLQQPIAHRGAVLLGQHE